MTRMTGAEGFVWGAFMTLFAAALAADILGNAGILRPWTENYTAMLTGVMMITAGLSMIWSHYAVEPIAQAERPPFDAMHWAIFILGLSPLFLHAAYLLGTEVFEMPLTPVVTPRFFPASIMLLAAFAVWRNRKFPQIGKSRT